MIGSRPPIVEHLTGIADVVERWRAVAPGVAWLLTSRSRVGVNDEVVLELAGLSYPSDAGDPDLTSYDTVQLLVRRARTVGSEIDPVLPWAARLGRPTTRNRVAGSPTRPHAFRHGMTVDSR